MKNLFFLQWFISLFLVPLWRMSIVGASVEGISIGGRNFPVAADADVTIDLGGDSNTVEMNGDGTGRLIKFY